jgi:hypothetical protein
VCESNQGGDAAFWWHMRNTGRPCRCRIAGKCLYTFGRHALGSPRFGI